MWSSYIQKITNKGGTDKRSNTNTKVDDTEKVSDVIINDTDQNNHTRDLCPKSCTKDDGSDSLGREALKELTD